MDVQRRLQAKRRSVNRAVKDLRAEVDLEDDSSVSSDMEEHSGAAVPVDGLDTPSEFTQSRILAVGDDLSLESDISTSCTRFDFNDQQCSNSEKSCHSSDTYVGIKANLNYLLQTIHAYKQVQHFIHNLTWMTFQLVIPVACNCGLFCAK